jgi:hypothetical protein
VSDNLVPVLKSLVTTFSEGIKYNCKHRDELCVGGKIVSILNMSQLMANPEEMVYLTLDDDVGKMSLMVPGTIFKQLNEKFSLTEGMVVLANGRLLDPEGELKKKRSKIDMATIMCWNVEPLQKATKEE